MPSAGHCGRHHNYRCRICEIKFPNSYNSDWTPQDAEEMEAQLAAHAELVEAARLLIDTAEFDGDASVVNTSDLESLATALAKLEEAGNAH